MRLALLVVSVVVVLTAGCISTNSPVTSPAAPPTTELPTTTTESPDRTPVPSLNLTSPGVPCGDDLWVGFWGLTQPSGAWDQNLVRVGYDVPPNTSFLVVTYIDGSPEGVKYENNTDGGGVHTDGARLHLNTNYSGEHTVEVVLYQDGNSNGRFEQDVDSPCLNDGEPVTTGPEQVNFSRFE